MLAVLDDVCAGVEYIHSKRITHGDLNPSNILFKFESTNFSTTAEALRGGGANAKLSDFGMALRMTPEATHVSNYRQGTPFYVAPEVVREHRVLHASDVYALGVTMWELMAGEAVYVSTCAPPSLLLTCAWQALAMFEHSAAVTDWITMFNTLCSLQHTGQSAISQH